MTTNYTTAQIAEMRDWVLDCAGTVFDEDIILSMTDLEVVRWVSRNYEGGVAQYMFDSIPV